ncbi:MAG: hypothetical protein Satyrvirus25_2 [Satyrvirus sp.]|uniref:non-specific serine/threonine protein kinase n=1 Tax=Satyrvirus sp. TaxID=2487771 RepID=A0A3G5AEK3_9VIRU|nr:MAG: hypothetical protein Satyrvirus25_2 [Satyrvirus sp.]
MDNNENNIGDIEPDYENTLPIITEIIYPGLILKNDYILLKQIGYGSNATVWIVYMISKKCVLAMKIQNHECFKDGCKEVAILEKINSYTKENPSKNTNCIKMLDYFIYEEKKNMRYVCSVYDLYGGNLNILLQKGKYKYGYPIQVVKKITKQLLNALVILHNDLKIIHTDVRPENILFKGLPDYYLKIFNAFTYSGFNEKYEDLLKKYSNNQPKLMEELEVLAVVSVKRIELVDNNYESSSEEDSASASASDEYVSEEESNLDGENGSSDLSVISDDDKYNKRNQSIDDVIEILDYTEMHNLDQEAGYNFDNILNNRENSGDKVEVVSDSYIINCEIVLTDFGNAYFFNKKTKNEIQSRFYRAPEVILDLNYDYLCDIWSVSCVVFELLTGFALFNVAENPLNKDIHQLYLMEKILGPMPLSMKKKSRRTRFLFDRKRNYHIKNVEKFKPFPLKEKLIKQFMFSERDAYEINDFLMCGFSYLPSQRMTAKQLLCHKWLNS